MTKTFTLLFLILTITLPSLAQKIRFNDTTNIWITCSSDPHTWMVDKHGNTIKPSYGNRITKDTLMHGYTYYYHDRYRAWIREEDTTALKFYFRLHPDSAEYVFMDFTMNIGDTLHFLNSPYKLTLTKIDSILVNGVYHRTHGYAGSYTGLMMLEGIGPEHSGVEGLEYPYYSICCFETNGQRPALPYPQVWFNNVSSCVTAIKDVAANDRATVAPNPVTADSRIILPQTISRGMLTITNALGQIVSSREIKNEMKLALPGTLPAGVYFYRVANTVKEESYSGKFIAE